MYYLVRSWFALTSRDVVCITVLLLSMGRWNVMLHHLT